MGDPWKKLKSDLEVYAKILKPEANKRMILRVLTLIEKALLAWFRENGSAIRSWDIYQTHHASLVKFRENLSTAVTNRRISELRRDILSWRERFLRDSIMRQLDFGREFENLQNLIENPSPIPPNMVLPPPERNTAPAPPGPPAARARDAWPRTDNQHASASNAPRHPPSQPRGPPAPEPRRRAQSTLGRSRPPAWPEDHPAQQPAMPDYGRSYQLEPLSPMPPARSRQPSEASQSSRRRPQRIESLVGTQPRPPPIPTQMPRVPPPPQPAPPVNPAIASLRRSQTHHAPHPSLSDIINPALPGPLPFPTMQQAARAPAPSAPPSLLRSLFGRSNSSAQPYARHPAPSEPDLRQFATARPPGPDATYSETVAYDLQMQEFRRAEAARPPVPPVPQQARETPEQRRRRLKGKARQEEPRYFWDKGPGGSGPSHHGPPAGGAGASPW